MKHLKALVKWNRLWNFTCVNTISLSFETYFHGKLFLMFFQVNIFIFSSEKMQNEQWYIKGSCSLKVEISRFPIGFRKLCEGEWFWRKGSWLVCLPGHPAVWCILDMAQDSYRHGTSESETQTNKYYMYAGWKRAFDLLPWLISHCRDVSYT